MEIYINGHRAMLKKGTSFDYVSENRLFSGSDDYTLSIVLPLRGCSENIKIFGHINRADVVAKKIIYDCEIKDRNFNKFGSVTIVEIDDAEVKVQFLEGRSEQNFDETLDDIYINEFKLGEGEPYPSLTPYDVWNPLTTNFKCVALPWVNNSTGIIQNEPEYDESSKRFSWGSSSTASTRPGTSRPGSGAYTPHPWVGSTKALSWQPYLLYITKEICKQIGYSIDLSAWENDEELKYLLICNCLPSSWDIREFARALPHWSVTEYFEKLELFLGMEFDIDHRAKSIKFQFTDDVLKKLPVVKLNNVVDEHNVEVTVEEENSDYRFSKYIYYKECSHLMQKFYSCDWFIESWDNILSYKNLKELINDNKHLHYWDAYQYRPADAAIKNRSKVLYAEDVDCYFVMRTVDERRDGNHLYYTMELRPINLLGGVKTEDKDREDMEDLEIEFVPVCIDVTDEEHGRVMFLEPSGYDEDYDTSELDDKMYQSLPVKTLEAGEKNEISEYFSDIYIGWWDGALDGGAGSRLPHPHVEDVEVSEDWQYYSQLRFSLRLKHTVLHKSSAIHKIDPKQKFTFKFLSDTIPNPRSVFIIHGKRYLCASMTSTFTENGKSELIKGYFYPIVDEN